MYCTPRHYAYQPLEASHHEVVVVGGGPVGLATALGPTRRGIREIARDYHEAISLTRST
jgi:thioredoxin reductase